MDNVFWQGIKGLFPVMIEIISCIKVLFSLYIRLGWPVELQSERRRSFVPLRRGRPPCNNHNNPNRRNDWITAMETMTSLCRASPTAVWHAALWGNEFALTSECCLSHLKGCNTNIHAADCSGTYFYPLRWNLYHRHIQLKMKHWESVGGVIYHIW